MITKRYISLQIGYKAGLQSGNIITQSPAFVKSKFSENNKFIRSIVWEAPFAYNNITKKPEESEKSMKFGFYTLGCKVNLFETQALMRLAQARGHEICSRDADAFIINTCSVTAVSDHKNLRAFHKIRRENPRAVIAACGCFAQTEPDKLRATGEIDLICGTSARADVLALCEAAVAGRRETDLSRFRMPGRAFEPLPAGVPQGRTRALLKLEDGCDNYCAYCIIPYARGHVRSLPLAEAVHEAERLRDAGVHEIVLTGIEISSYGRDLDGQPTLTDAAETLCRAVPAVYFRLGSLEPRTVNADFCARLSALPNLRPHFHLSLQSGCDAVLARMKRRYDTAFFLERCRMLRAAFPDCSITTDLIVGFPGETEDEFAQTLAFLETCALSDVHVFPYSARPGTPAADMDGQLPQTEKEVRAVRAKAVAARTARAYRLRFVGRTLNVLFEHRTPNGAWSGHSPYCFPVRASHPAIAKNRFVPVRITQVTEDGLSGTALL